MGRGDGDFNAWEKMRLGWITSTLAAAGPGLYTIDRPDRPSTLPQAFSVTTARTEYWFENRQERLPFLGTVLPTGVLVRTTGPPTTPPQFRTPPTQTLLLPNAAGPGRAALQPGQTFSVPGVFAVTVETQVDGQSRAAVPLGRHDRPRGAEDRLARRQARPAGRISTCAGTRRPSRAAASSRTTSRSTAARRVRVPVQFPLTPYATFATPRAGAHRVAVRAIDRAGNRGPAAVRRFAVTAAH